MIDPIYIGRSGLRAQQQAVTTISNNIANLSATGFKREIAQQSAVVSVSPLRGQVGGAADAQPLGVTVSAIERNMSQGQLQETGRPLDVAISGGGFFVLQRPDGEQVYARAGAFGVDGEGYMADRNGNRLQPEIQIQGDASDLAIDRTGLVTIRKPDGSFEELGELQIARFSNPDGLMMDGSGVYLESDRAGQAIDSKAGEASSGYFMQGYLENSNVNLVDEFTSLVMAQRAYEASAKVVQTAGSLFEVANGLLRA
ncbi:flagellar hook-basal body protein [Andreprevotia chitinilytica]|uniref:flagellar hook-basal body protein n=1 Tax=Andreprevotia chitinilytica TaxID=396808 RepID=UPI0005511230|nr:flagellar hook basal-body protein [Andreprevotia chitinilytica]